MKRLRSSDDLEDSNTNRSFSHRNFYYKSENGRKGLSSSSSRYDRTVDDDRESSRMVRKRPEHDFEGFDRRKGFDRYRDCGGGGSGDRGGGGMMSSSPRGGGYGGDRIHRSESFCGSRREFPKGFRSERDRSRREGSVSSWRRFGGSMEFDEGVRSGGNDLVRGNRDRGNVRSPPPKGWRDSNLKSPTWSKESGSEQSRMRSPPKGSRDAKLKSPTWSKDSGSEQSKMRSPKGLTDGNSKSKSPTWSKDSGSEQSKTGSPQGLRDARSSPPWSKDSGSEQSKSGEDKKNDELQVGSDSSSEMEEGELEPEPDTDPAPELGAENEAQAHLGLNPDQKEVESERQDEDGNTVMEDAAKSHADEEIEPDKETIHGKEVDELSDCQNYSIQGTSGGSDENETISGNDGGEKEQFTRENSNRKEELGNGAFVEKSLTSGDDCKEGRGIDLEVKAEDIDLTARNKEIAEENGAPEVNLSLVMQGLTQNYKDKGKSVAVTATHVAKSAEDGGWIERESRDLLTCREDDMEGPSCRGFELFSSSPVKRPEKTDQLGLSKHKDERMELEPLDLSLSLPNVLLPIGSRDTIQAPGSPSRGRSVQSLTNTFCTNSDGFTASMSFSGSHPFVHNPSCSLTQNSYDNYEQSVGSHPIFQGVDQVAQGGLQGQSLNETKHKEIPLYQRILMNGNGSLPQSQALQGSSNGQDLLGQHQRALEGNSKMPVGLDRQSSLHKQLSGVQPWHHNDVRSTSQGVGSRETASEYSKDRKRMREKSGGSLYRSSSLKEQEQLQIAGADFVETIITRIVSEPIHVMSRRFHEMTEQSIACLKESVCEIILNADKQGQPRAFQKALQKRSEITLEMLSNAHRAQLEILVALKTGLQEFLQRSNSVSRSDLAEIFLNLKCRNISCRSPLPVDECDCKICVQKNGFCSSCMCLICSKFDMAYQTCSWVGCDDCLHWCHTNCALRESYIRNGSSANGVEGMTEMQFHCVACNQPSEMFGFVKDVFQNCAKEWNVETLARELECVKRIFHASEDVRGKQLHDIADKMLSGLVNKSDLSEVYNHVMGFLTGSESSKFGNTSTFSSKELPTKNQGEGSNGIAGPSREAIWLKPVYPERTPQLERSASIPVYSERAPQLEKSASILPYFDSKRNDKRVMDSELQRSAQKEPVFDELESIVRIKQAEAKMFQARADDARREAEGLKRIAIAKSEKIEEEYTSRIAKLRLPEAEEMRKQKFEELQVLDRAHREYFTMKMRMEADIKDLLLKMEATKRNLTM